MFKKKNVKNPTKKFTKVSVFIYNRQVPVLSCYSLVFAYIRLLQGHTNLKNMVKIHASKTFNFFYEKSEHDDILVGNASFEKRQSFDLDIGP